MAKIIKRFAKVKNTADLWAVHGGHFENRE